MKDEFFDIKKQMKFCKELVLRLDKEIQSEKPQGRFFIGMENRARKQEDIKRIRREFLLLGKMLNPYWRGESE